MSRQVPVGKTGMAPAKLFVQRCCLIWRNSTSYSSAILPELAGWSVAGRSMSAFVGGMSRGNADRSAEPLTADVRPADVQRQLQRILASPELRRSNRLADFLAYVVEETLEGRQDRIKAYSIGIEVFGRDGTFDPQLDPVVRIEAGRLRRELEHYYLATGRDDAIGVDIPKGAYVPRFFYRAQVARRGEPEPMVPLAVPVPSARPADGARQHWRWAVTGAVIACLFALVWLGTRLERAENAVANAAAAQPSILVLPFADRGGKDIARRAAAISDELMAHLVRFREVTVIAPEGAGAPDPARWPAARYLLDGSVRADDSRLRVTARLVDRTSGTMLWSDVYDIDPNAPEAITLEEGIASRVAAAVAQPHGVLFGSRERTGDRPPADLPAP